MAGPGAEIKPGGVEETKKPVWYVTGFDYPEGYDWMSDLEAGSVKCSMVVYANAVPMLKVPVGNEYQTSADPDMHRMIGGDLYTDYSTDSLTVIKKNGKHMFSYPGREMIVSIRERICVCRESLWDREGYRAILFLRWRGGFPGRCER